MAGMDRRNVGKLQRKKELNLEKSGSPANRVDSEILHDLGISISCTYGIGVGLE